MKSKFILFLLFTEILIISSTIGALGVLQKLSEGNSLFFEGTFLFLSLNTLVLFIFTYIDKYIERMLQNIQQSLGKINRLNLKETPNKKMFFKTNGFSNKLRYFLDVIQVYLKEQNSLIDEYTRLNNELEKSNKIRDVILELSHSVIEIDNIDKLFNLILEKAINVIDDAQKGSLLVITDNNILEYKAAIGFDFDKLKNVKLRLEDTFLWNESNGNITKPCIIRNVGEFDKSYLDYDNYKLLKEVNALDIHTTLSSPIIINGKLYGMLNIDSLDENAFDEKDISLMSYFANQIGIAIRNHKLIEKTLHLSRYDCLTNVYNRHYFEDVLRKVFAKALRYKETFSLVVFDLDNLKQINDTFGHAIGDLTIQIFSKTIKENIRDSDLFARYGGDEFVGVFFNSSEKDIKKKIISIRKKLRENPVVIEDKEIPISFSFGISNFPKDAYDIDTLFRVADEKMYKFKEGKIVKVV